MLLAISYSELAYPITLVEPLKASLYDYFLIWFILFTLYSFKLQKIYILQIQKCVIWIQHTRYVLVNFY